ncbi:MAG: PadR family transcriptional regulator [Armatimonadota bacterium]
MQTASLTIFEYALLGLIGMSPMSGYDVHKVFATTPLAHFSSSPGAIYPALRRLHRRGLLIARLDSAKEARPRRLYSLSKAGEQAITAWLHRPVTREELIRGGGAPILRFALGEGRLSKDEVLGYLETYKSALGSYLEELEGHRRRMPDDVPLHSRLALEQGIGGFRSELAWVRSAAAAVRRSARRPRRPRGAR